MEGLLFYFTVSLSILVAFLVAWTFYTGKKLHSAILKVIIYVFLVLSVCAAQDDFTDDDDGLIIVDDKPLVFPKEMPKAIEIINTESSVAVDYISQEDAWRLMAYEFLHGINNTTVKPLGPKNIVM